MGTQTKKSTKFVLEFEKPIVELEEKIEEMRQLAGNLDIRGEVSRLESKVHRLRKEVFANLTRWQRVQLARHPERPFALDYLRILFTEFTELHGDRAFGDDPAIVGGLARLAGEPVVVVGHQKGRDTKSNVYRKFGMPDPEGYRKAGRLFRLAEKMNMPVITLIDTPGAYPGIEAEERGQAEAIAHNIKLMTSLRVPIIVVIIGEGASGGALGIGVGDRILMLENSWYSVIAPESCSSILWRSWDYKEQAAESLQLTANDLLRHKLIDTIVEEPLGGAHRDYIGAAQILEKAIMKALKEVRSLSPEKLVEKRLQKFMEMGVWTSGS